MRLKIAGGAKHSQSQRIYVVNGNSSSGPSIDSHYRRHSGDSHTVAVHILYSRLRPNHRDQHLPAEPPAAVDRAGHAAEPVHIAVRRAALVRPLPAVRISGVQEVAVVPQADTPADSQEDRQRLAPARMPAHRRLR
jgi:hypothetical protein